MKLELILLTVSSVFDEIKNENFHCHRHKSILITKILRNTCVSNKQIQHKKASNTNNVHPIFQLKFFCFAPQNRIGQTRQRQKSNRKIYIIISIFMVHLKLENGLILCECAVCLSVLLQLLRSKHIK